MEVKIPIRVKGADIWGNRFEEITRSVNVSSDGACFVLKSNIKPGSILELSLPLPRHMQRSVVPKAVYKTVGFVTRVEFAKKTQTLRVAVKFRVNYIHTKLDGFFFFGANVF